MDKKSFILYQDSLDVLDVMTDEQCWKLFKKMKSYHNWNTYVCDDKTVDIVFVQFKNQFDRDKQKYEDEIEKRRRAGSLGGKVTQSKLKQVEANQASAWNAQANQGDNVNDNVNDNDTRIKKFIPPSLEDVKQYFKENWYLETIAIKAFKWYDVANRHDSKGNPIKNWKQKMINVRFTPENIDKSPVKKQAPDREAEINRPIWVTAD